tara:strand:+ start:773 stop:949 length:177 start_codon:yes stop_codon:yes gene_type:complete
MSKTYRKLVKNRFKQKRTKRYKNQKREFIEGVEEDESLLDETGEVREVQKENEAGKSE